MCASSQQGSDWYHRLDGRGICTLDLAEQPPGCRDEGGSNTKWEIAIMAYIITDTCTKDELCVEACPTDCIHPEEG